jgi:hypothetical protein
VFRFGFCSAESVITFQGIRGRRGKSEKQKEGWQNKPKGNINKPKALRKTGYSI